VTAETAPATAPRTVVAAAAILEGFFGAALRLDREAAARAAVFRFDAFVLGVGRRLATRDFGVDFFRVAVFATLPGFRLATVPPASEHRETLIMDHSDPRALVCCAPAPTGCRPSPNSSIIFLLNAGISSGFLDVTSPLSTTHSESTHWAPALRKSLASDGHDVIRRPFTAPASMSVYGA